jgi:hypothetical protein
VSGDAAKIREALEHIEAVATFEPKHGARKIHRAIKDALAVLDAGVFLTAEEAETVRVAILGFRHWTGSLAQQELKHEVLRLLGGGEDNPTKGE